MHSTLHALIGNPSADLTVAKIIRDFCIYLDIALLLFCVSFSLILVWIPKWSGSRSQKNWKNFTKFYIKWIIYIVSHGVHDSILEFIIRACYVREMYEETQEGLGPIHKEKVIQELWSLVTQSQSASWAGANLWFMERVTLIYTCLVSDAVSINIYNILFSETECWARGIAAWSSWAALTVLFANAILGI